MKDRAYPDRQVETTRSETSADVSLAFAALGFDIAARTMSFWANVTANALQYWSATPQGAPKAAESDPPARAQAGSNVVAMPTAKERAARVERVRGNPSPSEPQPAIVLQPVTADDLKAISGIGPKLETMLNRLGISTYAQIAAWSEADIDRIESQFGFPGRVARDGWLGAAKTLAAKKPSGRGA